MLTLFRVRDYRIDTLKCVFILVTSRSLYRYQHFVRFYARARLRLLLRVSTFFLSSHSLPLPIRFLAMRPAFPFYMSLDSLKLLLTECQSGWNMVFPDTYIESVSYSCYRVSLWLCTGCPKKIVEAEKSLSGKWVKLRGRFSDITQRRWGIFEEECKNTFCEVIIYIYI